MVEVLYSGNGVFSGRRVKDASSSRDAFASR